MAHYDYAGKGSRTFQHLPGYKKIAAWQAASDLGALVNALVKQFGPGYYRLSDQMRAAAISVSANIAEGYCSGSLGNYMRYCEVARGSAGELGSYLQDCERWKLAEGEELAALLKRYSAATFYLDRLIRALRKKSSEGTWDRTYGVKEAAAPYKAAAEAPEEYTDVQISGIGPGWPEDRATTDEG